MNRALPKDHNGHEVVVGSRVRILSLPSSFIESLPENEKDDVRSMIGEVFEVTEIDEYGSPWVGKGWSSANGEEYRGHSVAMDPAEMEVVVDGSV